MSENCGLTGFPPDNSFWNRGWGIVIRNESVASYFKKVFFEDFRVSKNFSVKEIKTKDFVVGGRMQIQKGSYKPISKAFTLSNATATVIPVLAPDTAIDLSEETILGMINLASESIYGRCSQHKDIGVKKIILSLKQL